VFTSEDKLENMFLEFKNFNLDFNPSKVIGSQTSGQRVVYSKTNKIYFLLKDMWFKNNNSNR